MEKQATRVLRVLHSPKGGRKQLASGPCALSIITGLTAEAAGEEIRQFRRQPDRARVGHVDPMEMVAILRKLSYVDLPTHFGGKRPFLHTWSRTLEEAHVYLVLSGEHYRVIHRGKVTCSQQPEGLAIGHWITDQVDQAWRIWKQGGKKS